MSGRRVYSRFREPSPPNGQLRISRDVDVQPGETPDEIAVLSDAPGVVGEELTLALVSSAGEMELRVRVVGSRPYVMEGVVRHHVRLLCLSAVRLPHDDSRTARGRKQ